MRWDRLLLALGLSVILAGTASAKPEYDYCEKECKDCSCYTCEVKGECVDKKKPCAEIECKPICIPKIRFPWDKCCTPACHEVIMVKSLKMTEKDCGKKMVYKTTVKEVEGGGACCPTGCSTCTK